MEFGSDFVMMASSEVAALRWAETVLLLDRILELFVVLDSWVRDDRSF